MLLSERLTSQCLDQPLYSLTVQTTDGRSWVVSDPRALRSAVLLMDAYAHENQAASHLGGPFAFAELVSVVYGWVFTQARGWQQPWWQVAWLVNDAGHAENLHYAIKANYGLGGFSFEDLWGFRGLQSPLSGHAEVALKPDWNVTSNGPLGSSIGVAFGLSAADVWQGIKDRVTVVFLSDGALMEGETKEVLTAIPGFCVKKRLGPFVVVLSDNGIKLTGPTAQDSYDQNGYIRSLQACGFELIPVDGHDLVSLVDTVDRAFTAVINSPEKPVLIWAKTVKGKGLKAAEQSPTGGHGYFLKDVHQVGEALKEIWAPQEVHPDWWQRWQQLVHWSQKKSQNSRTERSSLFLKGFEGPKTRVQQGVGKALIQLRQEGYPIVAFSSDLHTSTGVSEFAKKFPQFHMDVGVAEAHMISAATGAAMQGMIPVVDTFAQFGLTKGQLPLLMNLLNESGVIALFSHIGAQDAADGASHQCWQYLNWIMGLPRTEVWLPASAAEMEKLLRFVVRDWNRRLSQKQPLLRHVFLYGREAFPESYGFESELTDDQEPAPGVWLHEPEAWDVILVVSPTLWSQVPAALEELSREGVQAAIWHPRRPLRVPQDSSWWSRVQRAQGRIVFWLEHQKTLGLWSHWLGRWALDGRLSQCQVEVVAFEGAYGRSGYVAAQLLEHWGLDGVQVARRILKRFWGHNA